jgi:large repetitive protein
MIRMRRQIARVSLVTLLAGLTIAIPGARAAFAVAPTISSFTPTSGPIGAPVVINGDNFTGPDPDVTAVKFNGVSAVFAVNNPNKITATVPPGATDGPIAVTNSDGTATSSASFDVTPSPVPTITSFNPTSGPVGTSVQITGTGLFGASAVTFNTTNATTFTVESNTRVTATVPGGATTGAIKVTTPGGTATSATNFTVTGGAFAITSFNPMSGVIGTSVVITGVGFTGVKRVRFNGTSATFTVKSNTQITATVPAGATTGPISVTKPGNNTATSSTSFTVVPPTIHQRTITLDLLRHLVARGLVTVNDGFGVCASNVPVKIQRLRDGRWRTVDIAQTNTDGTYREHIPDRVGTYRAVATRVGLNGGADVCARDRSPRERHSH